MLAEPVINEPDISIVRLDIDAVTRDAHIERATAAHAAWIIAVIPFVDHLAALVFQPQRMQQPRIDHAAGNTVEGRQLHFCALGTAGDRINAHDIIADGNARARRLRVPTLPALTRFLHLVPVTDRAVEAARLHDQPAISTHSSAVRMRAARCTMTSHHPR